MTSRFAPAKQLVVDALDSLVPELFGAGARQTHRYAARWAVTNKWRPKADLGQMSVWRDGARRGAWKDYVSGDKGDAIDLVAYALSGEVSEQSRMRALEWIEDRFGLRQMSTEARGELQRQAESRRATLIETEKLQDKSNRDRARKFFFACAPEISGTAAELYLGSRGIRLKDVPMLSAGLRFRADCEYWLGAARDGEGNKTGITPKFPALISVMVGARGGIGACHYTFLEPDGSGKLQTRDRGYVDDNGKGKSAKLMFPSTSGLFVPVTYGPSGLKHHEAAEKGIAGWVGITEGVEDALSAAIADGEIRMHAAGSLSGLLGVPDIEAARGYLIFKDNDWGKPQAEAAFDAALSRFKSFGKPVEEISMPADWGKDVNDVLNA